VLGLLLLVVTTSGAMLVYAPELLRAADPGAYAGGGPVALTLPEALEVARDHDPGFAPDFVTYAWGTYLLEDSGTHRRAHVDPADGTVLYDSETDGEGAVARLLELTTNLHACGLTCEEWIGYQAWLAAEVPGSGWAGFDGTPITWGGLLLGVTGLLLGFLAISGMWLWWPGPSRWRHALRVRWRRGRFARDYDLHQVAGMLAVPFLLLWAVTGAGFEFGFVGDAWYAALPGDAEDRTFASVEAEGPDITPAQAVAAAQEAVGTGADPVALNLPAEDDPAATYTVWLADGFDPYERTDFPGDVGVDVDRRSGAAAITFGDPAQPLAADLWEQWKYPTHAGFVVGPWWRALWFVAGLVPLLLAVTGVSTWLVRRRTRRARRTAASDPRPASPGPAGEVAAAAGPVDPAPPASRPGA